MDRIAEMQVFVRVADRRSFSLAADELQIPRATVTNMVKRLEQRLGVRLLERTTRQVRLTHEGEAYYHRCAQLLLDFEETESAFRDAPPNGLLRVNLQGTLARNVVMPHIVDFLDRYPGISLHASEDDRYIDLLAEGVDCVLRAGALQDSGLIARQVAQLTQVTVASPAYLARHGVPSSLEDLDGPGGHVAVDYVSSARGRPIPFEFCIGGEVVLRQMKARMSVTGTDLCTSAALAGAGMIQMPRYSIESELAAGRLVILLPQCPPPPLRVSVLYPQARQLSPRVKVFAQWLAHCFDERHRVLPL